MPTPHLQNFARVSQNQKIKNGPSIEGCLKSLAAAYEMNDFVAVARLHMDFGPLGARQNFEVAFNSYTAGGQVEGLQQVRYGGPVRDVSLFSIDNNGERSFHRF